MSTYLLVHGAFHGAWCWYKMVPRLERAGHKVIAPDLASLGRDRTPVSQVTLDGWAESICRILDAEPEPVVLVGHSRGGIVISQTAEKRPGKVKTLVYVCAHLLRNGESIASAVPPAERVPSVPSEDRTFITVRDENLRERVFGQCSDEDVALARLLLTPEPMAPLGTPLQLTEERYGRVPRVYIETLRDGSVSLALQRRMQAALPCRKVISMDTDHAPFFSAPDELAKHLLSLQ